MVDSAEMGNGDYIAGALFNLAKGDILEGESRTIGDQSTDEREKMRDPGHRGILTLGRS